MTTLIVEFLDELWELEPDDTLSFGREADIVVDDNPFLHRKLGNFVFRDGLWWVHNIGSSISIDLHDAATAGMAVISAGESQPVVFDQFIVRFEANRHPYEITGTLADAQHPKFPTVDVKSPGNTTQVFGEVRLTLDQRLMILALAEPRLRDMKNVNAEIPSTKEAAARLGWGTKKFNRKVDNVCERLSAQGVPGLAGSVSKLATGRRRRLVEHAIDSGLVTPEDLDALGQTGESSGS